jgi:hypothetical protein
MTAVGAATSEAVQLFISQLSRWGSKPSTVHLKRDTTSAVEQIPPSPPLLKGGGGGDFQRELVEDFAGVTAKLNSIGSKRHRRKARTAVTNGSIAGAVGQLRMKHINQLEGACAE